MMAAFRGSASTDTGRFQDKTRKMMNKINFPPELDVKIDMDKVEFAPFKKWITYKVEAITGFEDDILTGMIFRLLQSDSEPNAKKIYVTLVPFLERKVRKFMIELWNGLKSAQENGTGVSNSMLEEARKEAKTLKTKENHYGAQLEKRFRENEEKKDRKMKILKKEGNFKHYDNNKHDNNRDQDHHSRRRNRDEDVDRDRRRRRERSPRRKESSRQRKRLRSPSPPRIKKKQKTQCPSPPPPKHLSRSYKKKETVHQSPSSSESESSSDDSDSDESSS